MWEQKTLPQQRQNTADFQTVLIKNTMPLRHQNRNIIGQRERTLKTQQAKSTSSQRRRRCKQSSGCSTVRQNMQTDKWANSEIACFGCLCLFCIQSIPQVIQRFDVYMVLNSWGWTNPWEKPCLYLICAQLSALWTVHTTQIQLQQLALTCSTFHMGFTNTHVKRECSTLPPGAAATGSQWHRLTCLSMPEHSWWIIVTGFISEFIALITQSIWNVYFPQNFN